DPQGGSPGKLLSPAKRRRAADEIQELLLMSERRVCRVLDQARSTQRYEPLMMDKDDLLRKDMIRLATQYGRYGYRRITICLNQEGWQVNHKRVERMWILEGLKVPQKQP